MSVRHYDPRVKYENEQAADEAAIVWTSQSVEWAFEAISLGRPLRRSPFHEGNPELRRGNLVFQYSDEEITELAKCMCSVTYFAESFAKTKDSTGLISNIKLYPFQLKQLREFEKNKSSLLAWSRQASKTTTSAIFIAWKTVFNVDMRSAILGNKSATSGEVLARVGSIYKNLPFYMKPGVLGWNGGSISLDNGSSVLTAACTLDALNGKSINGVLYIDEFAFTFGGNKSQQEQFLANAQPVLSSFPDSRLILSSTPNGKDLFYELYDRSVKRLNSYISSTVYWWQIPNRSLEWALGIIGEIGLEQFKIQYELSFDVSMDKLLDPMTMQKLYRAQEKFLKGEYDYDVFTGFEKAFRFRKAEHFFQDTFYIFTSDLAEGIGADCTTQHAFKLAHKMIGPTVMIYFIQDFIFEANDQSIPTFARIVESVCKDVVDQEKIRYLYEANTYGDYFKQNIIGIVESDDYDEDDDFLDDFDGLDTEIFLKFRRSIESDKLTTGLRTNSAIKKIGVRALKTVFKTDTFIVTDEQTIEQITHFQKDKKGNYKAEVGHDDLVTPLVNLAFALLTKNVGLSELVEDYLESVGLGDRNWKFLCDLEFEALQKLAYVEAFVEELD